MKKRQPLLTVAILLTAAVSVQAFSYFYTENLAMPNWANWTVSGSLSSTSYTPGGYSGLTGNGSMLYNAQQYGGGVISMTLRIATPGGGDTFYAYLGAGAMNGEFCSACYSVAVSPSPYGANINVYQVVNQNWIMPGTPL